MSEVDYRLYLVTSGSGPRVAEVAAAAARGGAGVVQVRAKGLSAPDLLGLVHEVADAVAAAHPSTRVVVDDAVEVALEAMRRGWHVHGVHLGQDDMTPERAREILGPDALIGWTTGTAALVAEAELRAGVLDYIGCGPFRPTPTKDSGRTPLGIEGYPALVAATRLPMVAIGDVTPGDVPALARTGVAGVAMVRALMGADDPESVTRDVLAAWTFGRENPNG